MSNIPDNTEATASQSMRPVTYVGEGTVTRLAEFRRIQRHLLTQARSRTTFSAIGHSWLGISGGRGGDQYKLPRDRPQDWTVEPAPARLVTSYPP
jgi:hypothetical protein